MTPEETLIQQYFDAFNSHDIEGVMACFHDSGRIIHSQGRQIEGKDEVRRSHETSFALFPDGRCDLRTLTGHDGHPVAESFFHGTRPREGKVVEALGAEIADIVDGKIKELRDYHRPVTPKAA